MRISVVLTSYNHRKFLPERLATIYSQSQPWHELVIVDDCSSDGSVEFFKEYLSDPRVKLLTSSTNSGSPFRQWIRGLNETEGDLIWIAESDDSSETSFLEHMAKAIVETDATFAYCDSKLIDINSKLIGRVDGEVKGRPINRTRENPDLLLFEGHEYTRYNLKEANSIPNVSACLFKRSSLLRYSGSIFDFHYIGDWHLYVSLLDGGSVVKVGLDLNYHRQHQDTTRFRTRGVSEWGRVLMEHAINGSLLVSKHALSEADFRLSQGRLASAASWDYWLGQGLTDPVLLRKLLPTGVGRILILGFGKVGQKFYSALRDAEVQGRSILAFDSCIQRVSFGDETVEVFGLETISSIHVSGDIILIASFAFADEIEAYIAPLGLIGPRYRVSELLSDVSGKSR